MANSRLTFLLTVFCIVTALTGCREEPPKVNYELGIFPDSVMALDGLNTSWDDYNMDIEAGRINSSRQVVFSSNRKSSGSEFDLVSGMVGYTFGQTTGYFEMHSDMTSDSFVDGLLSVFNTSNDEFGPLRFFNGRNGMEYMVAATHTAGNGLDIVFTSYIPVYSQLPVFEVPVPASLFNSSSDDAYLSLGTTGDTAWFCSDRGGDFDIYTTFRPWQLDMDEWFTSEPVTPALVDSINTGSDEKCPFVRGRYMLFASDMPGGYGGFDLYCSVFRSGKWSSPLNLGPAINSAANEYRPVLGVDLQFENHFLIFSSDRPGGKGGYDLYFTGITLPL
jgi:hypothetical protein